MGLVGGNFDAAVAPPSPFVMRRTLDAAMSRRPAVTGLVMGAIYGIAMRFVALTEVELLGGAFVVMSVAFIFLVPLVLGTITVAKVPEPSWAYRVFAPWIPMLNAVFMASLLGWEGSICIVMSLPLMLLLASAGGIIGDTKIARGPGRPAALMLLPFVVAPLESRIEAPMRLVTTSTEIVIAAPPERVWPLVASVDSIRPHERRPALFTSMGFPEPVSATISGAGVGAVRRARFEKGVVFTEAVTRWEPGRILSFTIDPNTEEIPPTSLDPHVTIGGPYFDVLTGTYELHPLDGGRATRLVLRSEHRVSTRFNIYSGWWANRIMASIQANILAVHKARAERGS